MAKKSRTTDDPRSHGERSADALEGILRTGMDASELPKKARQRPHTTLHVQLATLLGLPGHGRALLERFGLVPTTTAARITCDSLVRVVLEHGARVLNVGHTHRVVTDRQHAALAATYQSCVFPGCQVKFSDCAIHHLWWHSMGGPTDLDLQLPVCESHHIWLHEGGYSITHPRGRAPRVPRLQGTHDRQPPAGSHRAARPAAPPSPFTARGHRRHRRGAEQRQRLASQPVSARNLGLERRRFRPASGPRPTTTERSRLTSASGAVPARCRLCTKDERDPCALACAVGGWMCGVRRAAPCTTAGAKQASQAPHRHCGPRVARASRLWRCGRHPH